MKYKSFLYYILRAQIYTKLANYSYRAKNNHWCHHSWILENLGRLCALLSSSRGGLSKGLQPLMDVFSRLYGALDPFHRQKASADQIVTKGQTGQN